MSNILKQTDYNCPYSENLKTKQEQELFKDAKACSLVNDRLCWYWHDSVKAEACNVRKELGVK